MPDNEVIRLQVYVMVKVAGRGPPLKFSRFSPQAEVLQLLEANFGRGRLQQDDSGIIILPSYPARESLTWAGDFTYIVAGKIRGWNS